MLQPIPRPISVSVSSTAASEPTLTHHPHPTLHETVSPRSSVAAAADPDAYEQPQPERNRESWATEYDDQSFYDNDA